MRLVQFREIYTRTLLDANNHLPAEHPSYQNAVLVNMRDR